MRTMPDMLLLQTGEREDASRPVSAPLLAASVPIGVDDSQTLLNPAAGGPITERLCKAPL